MTQKQKRIYQTVLRLLEYSTPLRTDCGVLCEKRCCRGDGQTGMLLFPGEESPLCVTEQAGRRLAVCGGRCKRGSRPLSCRIFPFCFLPDGKGGVRVEADPRAKAICPLARHSDEVAFSHRFLHRLRRAGQLLRRDDACLAFLRELAQETEQFEALRRQLTEK